MLSVGIPGRRGVRGPVRQVGVWQIPLPTVDSGTRGRGSAGTSTTKVFTGQTMSRNGGPSAVASETFEVATSSASVETDCGTVTVSSDAGAVTNLAASPVPVSPTPPDLRAFPCGLLGFDVESLSLGASASITVTLPTGLSVDEYWKLQNDAWYQLTDATIAGDTITFTLTDGGTGDADNTANGTIVDPGGPAVVQPAPPSPEPPSPAPPTPALVVLTQPSPAEQELPWTISVTLGQGTAEATCKSSDDDYPCVVTKESTIDPDGVLTAEVELRRS